MKKMANHGEILSNLIRYSGKSKGEVAVLLGIHPNHLSKLLKSEHITQKLRDKYATIFKIDVSVFDKGFVEPSNILTLKESDAAYNDKLNEEIESLKIENQQLKAEIYDLLKKVGGFNI